MKASRVPAGLAVLAAAASLSASLAASPPDAPTGCRLDDSSTTLLRIYECQEKLRIAAESATKLAAIERNGRLVGLRVADGAVLVEAAGGESFQVVTPHAVTEMREGRVAVDSGADTTSVFVREGGASVRQDGSSVTLRAGQGVDVASPAPPAPDPAPSPPAPTSARPAPPPPTSAQPSGSAPLPAPPARGAGGGRGRGLAVVTWTSERAGRLLARLGHH